MWKRYLHVLGIAFVVLGVGVVAYAGIGWATDDQLLVTDSSGTESLYELMVPPNMLLGGAALLIGAALIVTASRRT
jgi:hypothetical protein